MKTLILALVTVVGASAVADRWTLDQVNAVRPMVIAAMEAELAEEKGETGKVVGALEYYRVDLGATGNSMRGKMRVNIQMGDEAPRLTTISIFCHVHHHPHRTAVADAPSTDPAEGEAVGEEGHEGHEHEGGEGEEEEQELTPEEKALQEWLKTVDCH